MTNADTVRDQGPVIPEHILFGKSKAMRDVQRAVEGVSGASVPILLQGDSGTGKEALGREVHRRSPWQSGPFTRIEAQKLASRFRELATRRNPREPLPWHALGLGPAEAFPGTLFVDEVGSLEPTLQAGLNGLFAEHSDTKSSDGIDPASPRIICSTRRNLEKDAAAGSFRLDLLYRMNVVTIQLPRLRDRKEDISDLVGYFYEVACLEQNRGCPPIPAALLRALCAYDWPGNIRELESCVNSYVRSDGDAAVAEAFLSKQTREVPGHAPQTSRSLMPLKVYARQVAAEAEREMILRVLNETRWNRKEAAKVLRVSYPTLLHKLKQTGISRKHREADVAPAHEGQLS
jgi:two-component system, NtrC family, response regulator AtoC